MDTSSDYDLQTTAVLTNQIVSAQKLEDGEHGEVRSVIAELAAAGHQVEKLLQGVGKIAAGRKRAGQGPTRFKVAGLAFECRAGPRPHRQKRKRPP